MYALVIGRAFPDEKTGMMGIFEFEQAMALRKQGMKTVYAFCDTRSIKSLRQYSHANFQISDVPIYGYHLPIGGIPQKIFAKIKKYYYKKVLKNILKDQGIPEVIHVHFPLLTLTDEIWNLLIDLNRPIVVTEHWTKVQTKEIQSFRTKLLKRVVNEANTFICVGDPLKNSVIELTNTAKDIQVIPNMVAPTFFYEEEKNKKKNFKFITIGRLVEVKRFDLVIDAFAKAFSEDSNVHLNIVGGGPLFEQLKEQINSLGMNKRISMLGFLPREETANMLRKSDAYVSGSILETFGVPFIEAMACGKPVIGSENGPIDKYINEYNGVQFKPGDLEGLIVALKSVYDKRNKYDGREISETAQGLFSQKSVAEQLINIYSRESAKKLAINN